MKAKALKDFISTVHGNVATGDTITVDSTIGRKWVEAGMVEEVKEAKKVEATEVGDVPLASGRANESSSSPADQASNKKTRTGSSKKKRLSSTRQSS